jgi:hypothetical protein
MLKESNPVEQRIESLADKWKDAIDKRKGRIIRLHAKEEDEQMIDAFVWYMLGLDSLIDDIAFILDPLFTDEDTYSLRLLESLDTCIREWNELPKPEEINPVQVDWRPDLSLADKKNQAGLFVKNFNRLAETLDLEDGQYTVAILAVPVVEKWKKEINRWLENALEAGISSKVRILIMDTEESPVYDHLASRHPEEVIPIIPALDMDNVMSQVAAMGDPSDPATPYRIAFTNMMNAMGKKKSKAAIKEGETCIRIAGENTDRDPHWMIQTVVVNIALCNDRISVKDYKGALKRAEKAIEAALPVPEKLGDMVGMSILAQAFMNRGVMYCYPKKWENAIPDFISAAEYYIRANNLVVAIEAYRMAGFCASKSFRGEDAVHYLVTGFRLGEGINKETLKASTFSALIKQLINKNFREEISYEEIDKLASAVYGEDWEEIINRIWKKAPDLEEVVGG